MYYLIDITHAPPLVVVATHERDNHATMAQRYADQNGRPLAWAVGPNVDGSDGASDLPVVRPTVVVTPGPTPTPTQGVELAPVPAPPDEHVRLAQEMLDALIARSKATK